MNTETKKLSMPQNPKKGDFITFVKKCPYECRRGTHTVIGRWNGSYWDYDGRVRHCPACGYHGETIEVRECQPGDESRTDHRIGIIGQLLDGAKDAYAREGTASYLKSIRSLIPAELKPSSL